MNTLIYKRTHTGDPNNKGIFGCDDCLGRVRRWPFNAVIGVGGKRPRPGSEGIALKVTWTGINPRETANPARRGPRLKFGDFRLWDEDGPFLETLAPNLFRYMFEDQHVRVVMSRSLSPKLQEEVTKILRWAKKHRPIKPRGFGKKTLNKHTC